MNTRQLYEKTRNNPRDVRFSDLLRLVEAFGYAFVRQTGSHRIYRHPLIRRRLNLQPDKNGKVKPYQVRDFLTLVARHGLLMESDE